MKLPTAPTGCRLAFAVLAIVAALPAPRAGAESALFVAARSGATAVVAGLLADGTNPSLAEEDQRGWTPLMTAAAEGHVDVVAALLGAGAAVDQRNNAGRTALAFAALYGRSRVVLALLKAGADADHVDRDGTTALTLARAQGDLETIEALQEYTERAQDTPR